MITITKKVTITLNNGIEEIRIRIDYENQNLFTFYYVDAKNVETLFDSTKLLWQDINALNEFIENPIMGRNLRLGNSVLVFCEKEGITYCELNFRGGIIWPAEVMVTILAIKKIF